MADETGLPGGGPEDVDLDALFRQVGEYMRGGGAPDAQRDADDFWADFERALADYDGLAHHYGADLVAALRERSAGLLSRLKLSPDETTLRALSAFALLHLLADSPQPATASQPSLAMQAVHLRYPRLYGARFDEDGDLRLQLADATQVLVVWLHSCVEPAAVLEALAEFEQTGTFRRARGNARRRPALRYEFTFMAHGYRVHPEHATFAFTEQQDGTGQAVFCHFDAVTLREFVRVLAAGLLGDGVGGDAPSEG